MNPESFYLNIKSNQDDLESSSFSRLADVFAKLEGFDRALLGQSSVPITVKHKINNPSFLDCIWTAKITVLLSINKNEFDFLPEDAYKRIHKYLDKCRPMIINHLFPAEEINQVDLITSDINNNAKTLSKELNQQFIPNNHKILRTLCDLNTASKIESLKFKYNKSNNINLNNDDYITINEDIKKILMDTETIATEEYEKLLSVGIPNYHNKYGKWYFSNRIAKGYYIEDLEWIERVFSGLIVIKPRCNLHVTISFGPAGPLNKEQPFISKVHDVKEPFEQQISLPL